MPDPYREPTQEEKSSKPAAAPAPVKDAKVEQAPLPEQKEKPKEADVSPVKEKVKPIVPYLTATTPALAPPSPPVTEAIGDMSEDRQLKILVDLAFEKGINKAIETANATQNPYLIDKFHDTLTDELRDQLIEKKKLKEV